MAVITSVTLRDIQIAHSLSFYDGIKAEFVAIPDQLPDNFDGVLILVDTSDSPRLLDVPLIYGHKGLKRVLHLIRSPHEVKAPASINDYTVITGVDDFESEEIRNQIERFIQGDLNSVEKRN